MLNLCVTGLLWCATVHGSHYHSQVSFERPLCCSTPKRNQFIQGQEQQQEAGQGSWQEQLQEAGTESGQGARQESGQEQLQEVGQEQLQETGQEEERIRESGVLAHVKNTPLFKEISALCQVLCTLSLDPVPLTMYMSIWVKVSG